MRPFVHGGSVTTRPSGTTAVGVRPRAHNEDRKGALVLVVPTMAIVPLPRPAPDARDWTALVDDPIVLDELVEWATTPNAGAVVAFLGVVRDHAEGRADVVALTYEAYDEPARRRITEIVDSVRAEWPVLDRVAVVHRLGRLGLSETAVAVVVSSPHRHDAFDAGRACIDRVKERVPIWKKEHWADGSDWALGEQPITSGAPGATGAPGARGAPTSGTEAAWRS